ncbi:unnamed protein product [Prorocentrum cordatum]|uniref:Uncharacterized protein n=1 Tax=Prorocentrum cordatum TaxID=2364126 RepID=A0ABN9SNA0_9DINO|nr:unnamed protein product [Polarella glacialis]
MVPESLLTTVLREFVQCQKTHCRYCLVPQEKCEALSRVELIETIVDRDATIVEIPRDNENLRRLKRRETSTTSESGSHTSSDSRMSQLQLALAGQGDPNDAFALPRTGRTRGWLIPAIAISIAIRRNMSNVSTEDLGKISLEDISRYTVRRAEFKVGACLAGSARMFFDRVKDVVFCGADGDHDSFDIICIHNFKSNATNSSIWQRKSFLRS